MHKLKREPFQGAIVADADRIAAALRYQQELDAAQRPATMNPNLAAQGATGRALVAPPTSVMDERYPAWKKSQDDAEALMTAADLVGSAIPLAGPAFKGAKAVGRFAGPELAQGLENYMVRTGGILPMDTWHGSPHRFPPTAKNPLGEFDSSKIGTGEGAQAYGHGLYLAENPAVANEYRRTLRDINPSYDGAPISNADTVKKTAAELFMKAKGDKAAAIKDAQNYAFDNLLIPEINKMDASKVSYGALYKVDLPDEQIAKMLDWEKPLSQQHPDVQAAFKDFPKTMSGGDAYRAKSYGVPPSGFDEQGNALFDGMAALKGRNPQQASKALQELGIPGIRYLDQGSRTVAQPTYPGGFKISPPNTTVSGKWMVKGNDYNSKGMHFNSKAEAQKYLDKMFPDFVLPKPPQSTSNFVVFDPKHMNIIGRE